MRTATLLSLLALAATASAQDGVYVASQGNFRDGNGSVTQVPIGSQGSATQLFRGQLGTILQSATWYDDRLYLVGNSANKIDVIDAETNQRVGEITGGFSSPRYLEIVGFNSALRPARAYVSNQVYGGQSFVLPVDLVARTTGAPIPVDGLPEAVASFTEFGPEKAYVALGTFGPSAGGLDSLAVLDTENDALLRYIDVGCYARFVAAYVPLFSSNARFVLAFCEDTDEAVVVDVATDAVVQRLAFGEDIGDPFGVGQSVGPGRTVPTPTRRPVPASSTFLVITASGLAEVGQDSRTDEFQIVRRISIPEASTRPISAVGQPTFLGPIVLGRPDPSAPFETDGTVTVHDEDGRLLATYPAGIYPAHVAVDASERFDVAAEDGAAETFGLAVVGANPARSRTALAFSLDQPASVRVTVHDLLGRTVLAVDGGARGAGPHRLDLDVSALAAGPYRVRLVADGRASSAPLTVVR